MRDGWPVAEENPLPRCAASLGGGAVSATVAAVVTESDGDPAVGQILHLAIPYRYI